MITPERREELEAIADEIFSALATERYEPSERGAGWAATDKGCEDVIAILARSKAKMWKDSPAARRDLSIARRTWKAKQVAERLLGNVLTGVCKYCGKNVRRRKDDPNGWKDEEDALICTVSSFDQSLPTILHKVANDN